MNKQPEEMYVDIKTQIRLLEDLKMLGFSDPEEQKEIEELLNHLKESLKK
jgi:hypothetical protein